MSGTSLCDQNTNSTRISSVNLRSSFEEFSLIHRSWNVYSIPGHNAKVLRGSNGHKKLLVLKGPPLMEDKKIRNVSWKKHWNRYFDMIASRSICFFLRKSRSATRGKICLLRAMVATPAMVLPPKVLAVCGKQWSENLKQKTPEVNRSSLQVLHFSKCMTKFWSPQFILLPCESFICPSVCIILPSVTQVLVLSTVWESSGG